MCPASSQRSRHASVAIGTSSANRDPEMIHATVDSLNHRSAPSSSLADGSSQQSDRDASDRKKPFPLDGYDSDPNMTSPQRASAVSAIIGPCLCNQRTAISELVPRSMINFRELRRNSDIKRLVRPSAIQQFGRQASAHCIMMAVSVPPDS